MNLLLSASDVVDHLLECRSCGCKHKGFGKKPGLFKKQLDAGIKIEKEHTPSKAKRAKLAKTHLKENPHYYPLGKKPKGSKEALRWVKENQGPLFKVKA